MRRSVVSLTELLERQQATIEQDISYQLQPESNENRTMATSFQSIDRYKDLTTLAGMNMSGQHNNSLLLNYNLPNPIVPEQKPSFQVSPYRRQQEKVVPTMFYPQSQEDGYFTSQSQSQNSIQGKQLPTASQSFNLEQSKMTKMLLESGRLALAASQEHIQNEKKRLPELFSPVHKTLNSISSSLATQKEEHQTHSNELKKVYENVEKLVDIVKGFREELNKREATSKCDGCSSKVNQLVICVEKSFDEFKTQLSCMEKRLYKSLIVWISESKQKRHHVRDTPSTANYNCNTESLVDEEDLKFDIDDNISEDQVDSSSLEMNDIHEDLYGPQYALKQIQQARAKRRRTDVFDFT